MNNMNHQRPGANQINHIRIDPNELLKLPGIVCAGCGGGIFIKGMIKRILPLTHPLNKQGRKSVVNIEGEFCLNCKKQINPNEAPKPLERKPDPDDQAVKSDIKPDSE